MKKILLLIVILLNSCAMIDDLMYSKEFRIKEEEPRRNAKYDYWEQRERVKINGILKNPKKTDEAIKCIGRTYYFYSIKKCDDITDNTNMFSECVRLKEKEFSEENNKCIYK